MSGRGGLSLGHFAADLDRASSRDEWRSAWSIALLYRWPGVGLAWACARLGIAPAAVTVAAFLVALMLPVLALSLPPAAAPWAVFLAGAAFQVLDCADGTLARCTGRSSRTGADLDFLIDMAQWGLLYAALGLLADRAFDTGWAWTALALAAAWGRLLARVVRDRVGNGAAGAHAPVRPRDLPAVVLAGISGLIPLVALSGSWIGGWLVALAVYSLLDIAEGLLPLAKRG